MYILLCTALLHTNRKGSSLYLSGADGCLQVHLNLAKCTMNSVKDGNNLLCHCLEKFSPSSFPLISHIVEYLHLKKKNCINVSILISVMVVYTGIGLTPYHLKVSKGREGWIGEKF